LNINVQLFRKHGRSVEYTKVKTNKTVLANCKRKQITHPEVVYKERIIGSFHESKNSIGIYRYLTS